MYYDYAYALGWNAAEGDFTNFEETFSLPVLTAPNRVPRGSVRTRLASGHEVWDGWREVVLEQRGSDDGTTLFADLDAYVTAVHGGWDGADADISLKTRAQDGSFAYYNAIAHVPVLGEDYFHETQTIVRGLKLRYTVVADYEP